MGNLKKKYKDHENLRNQIDGKDQFFDGSSTHGSGWARHNERVRNTPEWATNDAAVRAIILRAFPKWNTNQTQYNRALDWIFIINRYFRLGEEASKIALEWRYIKRSPEQVSAEWDANPKYSGKVVSVDTWIKRVTDTVGRIVRVEKGLRASGKPRIGKMGRPKKS